MDWALSNTSGDSFSQWAERMMKTTLSTQDFELEEQLDLTKMLKVALVSTEYEFLAFKY